MMNKYYMIKYFWHYLQLWIGKGIIIVEGSITAKNVNIIGMTATPYVRIFVGLVKIMKNQTGVINYPLGQLHNDTISKYNFNLKIDPFGPPILAGSGLYFLKNHKTKNNLTWK